MEEIELATLNNCCELIYAENSVAYLGEGQGRGKFGLIVLRYGIEGALICETKRVTIRETTQ
jgi:predicted NBD/HSP70 family sugar kinase